MALVSSITDNFDDNTINSTLWNSRVDSGTVAETGAQLLITPSGTAYGYGGYQSVSTYDLTASRAYVKVPTVTNNVTGAETQFALFIDANNEVSFVKGGGSLIPRYRKAAVNDDGGYPTYNATNHVWWSMREASGTIYFETSTDGTTWTAFRSIAHTFTTAQLQAVQVRLLAGQYQAVTGQGTAAYDNLNTTGATIPTVPTGLTARPANTIVTMKWTPVTGATGYTLARATTSGGTLTNIYTGANTTFADTGLTNGSTYYYKVLATNSAGSSANSAEVTGTPAVPAANGTYNWHRYGTQPNLTISQLQTQVRAKYDSWFGFTMTTGGMPSGMTAGAKRIAVPDQIIYPATAVNSTVSEGMGYGMFLKACFSNPNLPVGIYDPYAKDDFDALLSYRKYFNNANGLMKWSINEVGVPLDQYGATDGDLDAAMALVLMSRLHGNVGTVAYTTEATTLINAIATYEIVPVTGVPSVGNYPNVMCNGDGWGFATDNMMPDYLRAGFFREFYYHTGNSRWLDILSINLDLMIKYYFDTFSGGVVPDRQTRTHTTITAAQDKPTYNSVRLGFAESYDYLWNGSNAGTIPYNMMDKMAAKAKTNWTTGGAVKAPDYADLNMSAGQTYSNLSGYGMVGPAATVTAVNQTFATEIYTAMNGSTEFASSYFNGGVGLMAMVCMSGIGQNFRPQPHNLILLGVGL